MKFIGAYSTIFPSPDANAPRGANRTSISSPAFTASGSFVAIVSQVSFRASGSNPRRQPRNENHLREKQSRSHVLSVAPCAIIHPPTTIPLMVCV